MTSDAIAAAPVPKANHGLQFVLSITAAVIGALAPGVIGDTTPEARLAGMTAAAVLPVVITWAGPWQSLRAGVGVLLAAGAIGLTYVGGTALDRDAFPVPEPIAESLGPEPTPEPTVAPVTPGGAAKNSLAVSPSEVDCSDGSCDEVRVTNVGSDRLTVSAELDDGGSGEFTVEEGCDQPLEPGDDCAIAVAFAASAQDGQRREATLRIAHDGNGSAKEVRLMADVPAAASVAVVPAGGVPCELTQAGELVVPFTLSPTGDQPSAVSVVGTIGDFTTDPREITVDGETGASLTFPSSVFAPGDPAQVTIAIDGSDAALPLAIDVPDQPQQFDCGQA